MISPSDPEQKKNVEQIIAKHTTRKEKEMVRVLGHNFVVYPDVFSPLIAPSGAVGLAVAQKPIWKNKFVLELGTGSGILSCLFALAGARKVLAFDVNPSALINTKENAERLGLKNIKTRLSDGLEALKKSERPDVIYCDPPFSTFRKPKNDLEKAFLDPELRVVYSLLSNLEKDSRLAETKLLLCLSSLTGEDEQEIFSGFKIVARPFLTTSSDWASFTLWEVIRK